MTGRRCVARSIKSHPYWSFADDQYEFWIRRWEKMHKKGATHWKIIKGWEKLWASRGYSPQFMDEVNPRWFLKPRLAPDDPWVVTGSGDTAPGFDNMSYHAQLVQQCEG